MAVNDREETVLTKVVFDGNWAKAGAIDTALTYGIIAVEAARRRIAFEVTGRRGIDSRNFGEITAIFTEVLLQQGHTIVSVTEFEEISSKIEELIERASEMRKRNHEALDRIVGLEIDLGRARAAVQAREDEIESLKALLNPRPKDDQFVASQCTRPTPYHPVTGDPCVFYGDPVTFHWHRTWDEESLLKTRYWEAGQGLDEEAARHAQAATKQQ